MSLVARHLEANGIPTVIIGSARDIVEHCGVPRLLFVDFPLGNLCGKPWEIDMQRRILQQALSLFETVKSPMTTVVSPEQWGSDAWKQQYMEVSDKNRAALAQQGVELRQRRAERQRRE